jgi:hypothetical protein
VRICDLCGKSAGDAKSLDSVVISILKECTLTNDTVHVIFDKLKIKPSLVEKRKMAGDVCAPCAKSLELEVTKTVNDGIAKIADSLVGVLSRKRDVVETQDNSAWFHEIGEGRGFRAIR